MEERARFAVIWKQAKDQYRTATNEDLDDPSLAHPATADDLLSSLDKQNSDFKAFREKRSQIFSTVAAVCRPIEAFADLAGDALSTFFPAKVCFGAVKYLVGAAKGVSESYGAILDLFETLKDFLGRLKIYSRGSLEPELQSKVAEILAILLQVFGQSAKVIKRGSLGRVLHFTKNALRGQDETLQDLLGKLDRLCQGEHRLVAAETLTEVKKTGHMLRNMGQAAEQTKTIVEDTHIQMDQVSSGLRDLRDEFRQGMQDVVDTKTQRNIDRIKGILQPSVYPRDMYRRIAKLRVPGTGDWIRNERLFQKWIGECDKPVLWISGSPGNGKTFIAQNIISFLQDQPLNSSSPISVGYFFFRDSDPKTRSFHLALRDMAFQIYQNDPLYRKYIDSNCHSPAEIETIQSTWQTLFEDYYFDTSQRRDHIALLVFDGVDEAFKNDRQTFLELLSDAENASNPFSIRILLVGRPEILDDIADALEETVPTIHVDSSKNSTDIATYVQNRIHKSRVLSRVPELQRLEIETTLIEKSQGMFLWADLMLRELNTKTRTSSILESLNKAPKGLDKMLQHVLETFSDILSEEQAADLNTILMWVTCADRPLTVRELNEALALESEYGDRILDLETTLRTQFASLFLLNREDGLTTADLQSKGMFSDENESDSDGTSEREQEQSFSSQPYTTTVVFCHASIGDYLRNPSHSKVCAGDSSIRVGVDIVQARATTLKLCLEWIVYRPAAGAYYMISGVYSYAVRHWTNHLKQVVNHLPSVDAQDKGEAGILLCQILGHVDLGMFEENILHIIKVISRENMELIATFLADKEFIDKIENEDMWIWIQECLRTPAQVFVPLAREAARVWLVENQYSIRVPYECMKAILNVVTLLQGGNTENKPESPSIETVLVTARWAQLEEDACWCEQVGLCLQLLEHYDAAIEYMESALKLQPIRWTAKKNLAELYGIQGRLDDAIRLLKECESRYEELKLENEDRETTDPEFVLYMDVASVRYSIGISYARQEDCENALHWLYCVCLDLDDRSSYYIFKALPAALRILLSLPEPNYKGIMQLIKSLDERHFYGTSFLYDCFNDNLNNAHFFSTLAVAAKETGELQWLESKYKGSMACFKMRDVTVMCLEESLAYLYYKFLNEEDKTLLIWNRLMTKRRTPLALQYGDYVTCKNRVCSEKSFRLFSRALNTNEELQPAIIQELEKICMDAMSTLLGTDALLGNLSAMYMGVWHRIHGRETHAKDYFKPYIKQALQMLCDVYPYNDMPVYISLGRVLAMAGDNDDAIAALQFAHTKLPTRDDTSTSEGHHMVSPWLVYAEVDVLWHCDICLRAWGNLIHSNVCCYCGATLCQACLNNMKKESIPTHACDPSHEWLNIPAPTALPGENEIIRGVEVLSTDEFISQLERAWT